MPQRTRPTAPHLTDCGILSGQDWADVQEFYGCGKFVSDSWQIFCRGELALQGVEDVNLRRYLRWANTDMAKEKKPAASEWPLLGWTVMPFALDTPTCGANCAGATLA